MTAASGGAQTARPTRLPRSARRKQLLAAAQQIFVAHGYHAAAMDDIAERAGVSKPVLYQHFPGKLELYLALLDTHCDAIIAKVRSAMLATPDNKERVKGAVAGVFRLRRPRERGVPARLRVRPAQRPAGPGAGGTGRAGLHRRGHRHHHLGHRRQPGQRRAARLRPGRRGRSVRAVLARRPAGRSPSARRKRWSRP